jgi:hypothetical protein
VMLGKKDRTASTQDSGGPGAGVSNLAER